MEKDKRSHPRCKLEHGWRLVRQAKHPFEEVRRILCYRLEPAQGSRFIPSVGIWPIVFLPVTQDWHSWRWLSGLQSSPAPDHCYSPAWPMRARLTYLGHIRPVSRQSGSDLSSSLLHHNNIFPSLPCPALPYPSLSPPDIRHWLLYFSSDCIPSVSLLLSSLSLQGKKVFSQCKRLYLKFRIEYVRRYSEYILSYNHTCHVSRAGRE